MAITNTVAFKQGGGGSKLSQFPILKKLQKMQAMENTAISTSEELGQRETSVK